MPHQNLIIVKAADNHNQNDENPSKPPGAPDRTPVKEPDEKKKPMGDPQPPKKKTPKLLGLVLLLITISANFFVVQAQVQSPATLGQPSYPSSGSTRNRGNVMGGESSVTRSSNLEGPVDPSETPSPERQEEQEGSDEAFELGPYNKEGEYQHFTPPE